jgi:hypothetical protein
MACLFNVLSEFINSIPTSVPTQKPQIKPLRRYLVTAHKIYFSTITMNDSRVSTVGIATGYRLDNRGVGVRVPVGSRIFTSTCHPDWLWGPPNLLSNGWGLFPQGREADHSPPTSAEVKKTWIYTFTPPYPSIA